jgi:hypothetical protein
MREAVAGRSKANEGGEQGWDTEYVAFVWRVTLVVGGVNGMWAFHEPC